jgi:hypothetical protein
MFVAAVEAMFGVYDHRSSLQDLLQLKQDSTVEEYIKQFQAMQFQVAMYNPAFDEMFFTAHFINGLKEEIKSVVHTHLPDSVDRAALLAKIQQQVIERAKSRPVKWSSTKASNAKQDIQQPNTSSTLWKERQLRDFRKANDLCYYCGEKFLPGHLQKCTKRTKPQVNAIVVNDLDVELKEDTLNQLAIEDALTSEMGQLSLNAISGTENGDSMRLRALVHNKVMLILVDSGSSHSFINSSFVYQAGLSTVPTQTMQLRVANGELLQSNSQVQGLE